MSNVHLILFSFLPYLKNSLTLLTEILRYAKENNGKSQYTALKKLLKKIK